MRPVPTFLALWAALAAWGWVSGSEPCLTIAGILFIFAVVPLAVVTVMDMATGPKRVRGPLGILFRFPTFAFGLSAVAIGGAISIWILYNSFVERLDSFTGPSIFLGLGVGPPMMAFGVTLVMDSLRPGGGQFAGDQGGLEDPRDFEDSEAYDDFDGDAAFASNEQDLH